MVRTNSRLVAIVGYGSTILWALGTVIGMAAGAALIGLGVWDLTVWVFDKDWWSTGFDGSILALAALAVISIVNRALLVPLRKWAERQATQGPPETG